MAHTVVLGDALNLLRQTRSQSIHLVVTDPPYSSLEKHRAVGTTTRLTKEWFPVVPNEYFVEFFTEVYRVLVPNAHCYVVSDQETARITCPMSEAAGFKWWKWLVWDKKHIGMGYHYRGRHELVAFFEKGARRLKDLGMADVLDGVRVRGGYPTEKPVEMLSKLVEQSSSPGEWVLDPFCGSGSTGEAALALGRNFIGCDVQPGAVDLARKRLEKFNGK